MLCVSDTLLACVYLWFTVLIIYNPFDWFTKLSHNIASIPVYHKYFHSLVITWSEMAHTVRWVNIILLDSRRKSWMAVINFQCMFCTSEVTSRPIRSVSCARASIVMSNNKVVIMKYHNDHPLVLVGTTLLISAGALTTASESAAELPPTGSLRCCCSCTVHQTNND